MLKLTAADGTVPIVEKHAGSWWELTSRFRDWAPVLWRTGAASSGTNGAALQGMAREEVIRVSHSLPITSVDWLVAGAWRR
jgi:hypothetical protein